MIIYNLTDRTPPWEKVRRTAQGLKLFGVVIPPGSFMEFKDFPLRAVTGLINSHTISVDNIPDWYQRVGDEQRHAENVKAERVQKQLQQEEEDEERKSRRRSRRRADD